MGSRWRAVVFDATDPARLARWWAEVLSYQVVDEALDEVVIAEQPGGRPELAFVAVPDGKGGKNRLHMDLDPDDPEGEVERLVNMGARRVDIGQEKGLGWTVLADPEGNEFCVLGAHTH